MAMRNGVVGAFVPDRYHKKLVTELVGFGLTHEEIAPLVIDYHTQQPISASSLRRHFRRELTLGLPKANATIARALFKAAAQGNVTAQIFWLKTRAGWREVQFVEVVPSPSEMSDEQLDRFIERGEADIRTREAGGNVASLSAYRKRPPPPG
jgi:hypothetical protein